MQGPPDDVALQGLDGYEQMVNTCAENAKAYWRLWGPLGEPMIRVVEMRAPCGSHGTAWKSSEGT
jgi:hypothetical protein